MIESQYNGLLVIISGPSGVGKSTICKRAVKKLDDTDLSVSLTTRPRSENETDGEDYHFVSRDEFEAKVNKGELLEYAEVFGNYYGTPKAKIEQDLEEGRTIIIEIDVQGARKAKVLHPDAAMVFILPPSKKELAKRMDLRGREEEDVAKERLALADQEIAAAWQHYEHMVINDDLDQAVDEVVDIIKSKREIEND